MLLLKIILKFRIYFGILYTISQEGAARAEWPACWREALCDEETYLGFLIRKTSRKGGFFKKWHPGFAEGKDLKAILIIFLR